MSLTKSPPLDLTYAVDFFAMLSVRSMVFPPFFGSRIQLVTACTFSWVLPCLGLLICLVWSLKLGLNVTVDIADYGV